MGKICFQTGFRVVDKQWSRRGPLVRLSRSGTWVLRPNDVASSRGQTPIHVTNLITRTWYRKRWSELAVKLRHSVELSPSSSIEVNRAILQELVIIGSHVKLPRLRWAHSHFFSAKLNRPVLLTVTPWRRTRTMTTMCYTHWAMYSIINEKVAKGNGSSSLFLPRGEYVTLLETRQRSSVRTRRTMKNDNERKLVIHPSGATTSLGAQ